MITATQLYKLIEQRCDSNGNPVRTIGEFEFVTWGHKGNADEVYRKIKERKALVILYPQDYFGRCLKIDFPHHGFGIRVINPYWVLRESTWKWVDRKPDDETLCLLRLAL